MDYTDPTVDYIDELDYIDYIEEMRYTKDISNACKTGDLKFLKKFFLMNENVERFDLDNPKSLARYLTYSEEHNQFEVVHFLISKGANAREIRCVRCKRYLLYVSDEMKKRRALRKIQNWWIPICYDVNHPKCGSGKRIFERSWERVQDDMKKIN